jgi:hypothetical protein
MPDGKSPAEWVNPLIDTANRRFFSSIHRADLLEW